MQVNYKQDIADWLRSEDRMAYVKDGVLHENESIAVVMVESESDLTTLTLEYVNPGAVAFTAGFAQVWQIDTDGVWHEV